MYIRAIGTKEAIITYKKANRLERVRQKTKLFSSFEMKKSMRTI